MGGIISSIIILIMVAAQSSLFNIIALDGAVPDLALVFLVLLSLKQTKTQTYLLAIWAGLLQDVIFYPAVGVSIGAKLFVTYVLINYVKPSMKENIYHAILLVIFSIFVHEIAMYVLLAMLGFTPFSLMWYMRYKLVPYLLYNLAATLVVYRPFNKFFDSRHFYEI